METVYLVVTLRRCQPNPFLLQIQTDATGLSRGTSRLFSTDGQF
jgi:hypothetical protein